VAAEKYLIFTIQGKYYTFPSKIISEVTAFDRVYPLPLVPDYVCGLINRYSAPFALLDLGLLIQKTPTPKSKIIVLKESVDKLAFLIEDVLDIVDVPVSSLVKVEKAAGKNEPDDEFIEATFEWKGVNVLVLDIKRILERIQHAFG
jgi:purine-binding chemotaxis protein CheW